MDAGPFVVLGTNVSAVPITSAFAGVAVADYSALRACTSTDPEGNLVTFGQTLEGED